MEQEENAVCKGKEFFASLSEETTMSRKEYVLTITTCLLGGMVIGMFCSPKKFTKIGCGNGSNNSNNRVSNDENIAAKAEAKPKVRKCQKENKK